MADCSSGTCTIRFTTRAEKRINYEKDPQQAREIWQGLRDDLFRIGHNYFASTYTLGGIEGFLHDAWDEFIHAAMLHPADSAELDRLVTLVLEVRELGVFSQKCPAHENANAQSVPDTREEKQEEKEAIMSNGQRLWTNLPFLASDMYGFWSKESGALTGTQRGSLAAFTSKLCSAGVCAPELARCAVWLFAQALETELPSETMVEMLPACEEWFCYSKTTLVKMCRDNHGAGSSAENDNAMSGAVGPLVTDAETRQRGSFSIARWLFWRKRAGHIYADGSGHVSRLGRACFELMVNAGLLVGVEVPGETVYLKRLFKALEEELASGRATGCVGAEDIEIDARWAEEA
ncbi:hypothetical protein E4U55_006176 [Claviceps digitariae]|nr:hypothetical protein E4U55_006176 [Claviceps digitariae]